VPKTREFFSDDVHLRGRGNERIAAIAADAIVRGGWIDRRAGRGSAAGGQQVKSPVGGQTRVRPGSDPDCGDILARNDPVYLYALAGTRVQGTSAGDTIRILRGFRMVLLISPSIVAVAVAGVLVAPWPQELQTSKPDPKTVTPTRARYRHAVQPRRTWTSCRA
jgi:hypothetical protein